MLEIDASIADALRDQNNREDASGLMTAKMIWTGTQAEYDELDSYDDQMLYFIVAETGTGSVASS